MYTCSSSAAWTITRVRSDSDTIAEASWSEDKGGLAPKLAAIAVAS